MAQADSQSANQCRALTESGERCSRPAQDDGFCYQHDEDAPTIDDEDESAASEDGGDASDGDEADTDEGGTEAETETGDESPSETDESTMSETEAETTDPADVDVEADVEEADEGIETVLAIRRSVESTAGQLIGRELDGVNEISATEDGWRAVVEVVERSAIPDTQDILGRYEIDLTEEGTVQGYRRIDRFRRDDTSDRE